MHTLLALSAGTDIALEHGLVIVGRDRRCNARLESDRVSRRHCILATEGGDVLVRDLGSTNGTFINGQRVASGRLKPGDEVSIAHIRYRLEMPSAHDASMAGVAGSTKEGSVHIDFVL